MKEKNMRKYLLSFGVISGALLLAGCTTPEVHKDAVKKDNLSFYPEKEKEGGEQTGVPKGKIAEKPVAKEDNMMTNKKMYSTPPEMAIDPAKKYVAKIKTDLGDIEVALAAKETPMTVNNFVFLAREKFYEGSIFHRTIKGFMIQGGDPTGTGMGGPGYKFADEPFAGKYVRGTVAMANSGPNTNGSQFFIMHEESALPPNYTIFGQAVSGLEVVDKIATAATKPGGEGSSPVTPVTIQSVTIEEK